uniref:C2H2-type domain-containing protein n=1 Tax=Timema monikensis TaxID=170555 RepID=A0A7R9E0E7_9NEOP|nr:unnamed protein product [Timema monikensis]
MSGSVIKKAGYDVKISHNVKDVDGSKESKGLKNADKDLKEEDTLNLEEFETKMIKPSNTATSFISCKQEITENLEIISEFQTGNENEVKLFNHLQTFDSVNNPRSRSKSLSPKEADDDCMSVESLPRTSTSPTGDTDEDDLDSFPVITMFPITSQEKPRKLAHSCRTCGKSFRQQYLVLQHEQIHLDDEKRKKFKCDVCNALLKTKRILKLHMTVHDETREDKYECEICGKKFFTTLALKQHVRVHCDERPYRCAYCGKAFKWSKNLTNHHRTHGIGIKPKGSKPKKTVTKPKGEKQTRLNTPRLQCQVCGKSLASKQTLYIHMRFHNGNLFQCILCGKTFNTKEGRNAHERAHTGEKQFCCDICGKFFGNKQLLRVHRGIHFDDRPHTCSYCSKAFRRRTHLVQHIRTHTGEKPYACEICPRAFAQVGDLSKHKLTHSGEREFVCECGETFKQKRNLDQHKKSHSKNDLVLLPASESS